METNSSAVIITTDGEISTIPYDTKNWYATLSNIVGGYIELVTVKISGVECHMYIHEEGKLLNLPANGYATDVALSCNGIGGWDFIAGNAVIVSAYINGWGQPERGFTDEELSIVVPGITTVWDIDL